MDHTRWHHGKHAVAALITAATLGLIVTGAAADVIELITPQEAAQQLAESNPDAVNNTPLEGEKVVPSVEATGDGFTVDGAKQDITIGEQASDPIGIETQSGEMSLAPQGIASTATDGAAIGDNAVVYANTGKDADTAIKPTEKGIETFTNIRSEDAAEDFSWKVALPGDERLSQRSDGSIAVIDPTPATPSDQTLPEPAEPGTAQGANAREESGFTAPDPDPNASAEAAAAPSKAGTEPPAGVAASEIVSVDVQPDEKASALQQAPASKPADSGPPSQEELKQQASEITDDSKAAAQESLQTGKESGDNAADASSEHNAAAIEDAPAVIATIKAPESVDANGKDVPTELRIEGDVVTMHVDHQDADVAYPIAADPLVEVLVIKIRLAWYPTFRQETYVDHWEQASTYIGSWHPSFCAMGMKCTYVAASWWGVNYNSGNYAAYWPTANWGPVWQQTWYPVYATRLVVDQWIPYWQPYWDTAVIDTDLFQFLDDGVTEELDGNDRDDGYVLRSGSTARRAPNCKRVRLNRKMAFPGILDMGRIRWSTRFCWNRSKRKTAYAKDSMTMEGNVRPYYEAIGYSVEEGDEEDGTYAWNGGSAVSMLQRAKLRYCPGIVHVGCVTMRKLKYVVFAHWDGTWRWEFHNDRA